MTDQFRSKVSVCIPTYNGSTYLRQAIESARTQTYSDFELLIVDDSSSDDTFQIVEEFAQGDSRVRAYQNPQRLGLVGNWNRCLELAGGEWIKFLFQDDYLHPTCIERLLELAEGSGAALVACQRDFQFESDLPVEFKNSFVRYVTENELAARFPNATGAIGAAEFASHAAVYPTLNCIGEPTAVMFHHSVVKRFGRFNPELRQLVDWEYWMRIATNAGLHYLDESLATFRVHRNAATFSTMDEPLILDRLIILYQLVYDPIYLPVRKAAREIQPTVDLKQQLFSLCKHLEPARVGKPAKREQNRALSLNQWNDIIRKYPRLRFHHFNYLLARGLGRLKFS
ncbi:MAG TPA: glycosyltransferase family 2 protein [Pyrinomonadaceae bacterium]|jgi:glycosyltransferase involved in cell wall biosynthesis|nr:glycosyltransferase family 2 protein [Pyrinomonadaceae bacterium]